MAAILKDRGLFAAASTEGTRFEAAGDGAAAIPGKSENGTGREVFLPVSLTFITSELRTCIHNR